MSHTITIVLTLAALTAVTAAASHPSSLAASCVAFSLVAATLVRQAVGARRSGAFAQGPGLSSSTPPQQQQYRP